MDKPTVEINTLTTDPLVGLYLWLLQLTLPVIWQGLIEDPAVLRVVVRDAERLTHMARMIGTPPGTA